MARETFEPATLTDIRRFGCRDLLMYCSSIHCNHSATMNLDHLPDDTTVRSLGARMVCTRCGAIRVDVQPDWRPRTNRPPP